MTNDESTTQRFGVNDLYPNGRCPACGFGVDEQGRCYQRECSAFDADSPYAGYDDDSVYTLAASLTPPTPVYRYGTWVTSKDGTVRVCLDYIGEGYQGDYDEDDPDDAALYRLDVNVAAHLSDKVWGEPIDNDPAWVYPADGSICTVVHVEETDNDTCLDLLAYAAEAIAEAITSGTRSVKHTMDLLSYLPAKR